MPNYKCQFVFVALFLLIFAQKAKTLRCFTCSTLSTVECRDPFDVQQFTLQNECGYNEVCVKHKTHETYLSQQELKRGCVSEEYCDLEPYSEFCSTCSSDLCNSSSTIAPSLVFVVLVLVYKCLL